MRQQASWQLLSNYSPHTVITGIDEVGRGVWAGPVVAASVVLPVGIEIAGLSDSKLVPVKQRLQLNRCIRRCALAIGIGWVSALEVDQHGLSWAVRTSGLRALHDMDLPVDIIILDGSHNYLSDDTRSRAIVHADALISPVAAASIIAKVARDTYMQALERKYPGYGFGHHVGYGTAEHMAALTTHGVTADHRRSVKPIAERFLSKTS